VRLQTATPPFVQKKKIATSTTAHQNSNKTKELQSTGKLSRKDFCVVWNFYGGRLFISRQDRRSKESTAAKID
jgi:hypothetical protein